MVCYDRIEHSSGTESYMVCYDRIEHSSGTESSLRPGADPGFLERVVICIKGWVFTLLILSNFSLISHENEIIWSH